MSISAENFGIACQKMVDSGKCNNDCCGPVPIPKETWEKHQGKAERVVEVCMDEEILVITETPSCCFLGGDSKCKIYEDRPSVCKRFGPSEIKILQCPHLKPSGNPRSEASKKQLMRENNRNVQSKMQQIRKGGINGQG